MLERVLALLGVTGPDALAALDAAGELTPAGPLRGGPGGFRYPRLHPRGRAHGVAGSTVDRRPQLPVRWRHAHHRGHAVRRRAGHRTGPQRRVGSLRRSAPAPGSVGAHRTLAGGDRGRGQGGGHVWRLCGGAFQLAPMTSRCPPTALSRCPPGCAKHIDMGRLLKMERLLPSGRKALIVAMDQPRAIYSGALADPGKVLDKLRPRTSMGTC